MIGPTSLATPSRVSASLQLRSVIAHAPVVLFALDRDGRFTLSDGRGLEPLGLAPGEAVGISALERYRDHPAIVEAVRRALAGHPVSTLLELRDRVFDVHLEPLADATGAGDGVVGVAHDVTERVRSERRLAESEQRFRDIAEHIQEVFWVGDVRTRRVLYASPAFETLFGRTRGSVYEDPARLLAAVHPDDREMLRATGPAHARGEGTEVEYRVVRPDGGVRWARDRAFPVHDAAGRVIRVVGITEDVTERRAAEEQLRRTVTRLEATLESTADAILVVDESRQVSAFNQRFAAMWGFAEHALLGAGIARLAEAMIEQLEDPQTLVEQALGLALRPEAEQSGTLSFRDGRVVECRALPQSVDGRHAGRVFSFRDVTERLRAEERLRAHEEELRHAQKMEALGRLAGGVAHDFNNLLTAILGHAQLLGEMLPEGDPRRACALEIQGAGQRAAQLTRQLMALGYRQRFELQPLDLQEALDAMLPMLRSALGEAVALEVRHGAASPWVRADRGELEQVFMNLAVNARDAMAGSGTLALEIDEVAADAGAAPAGSGEPWVRLRVRDTGAGMSAEVRARVFEPFFTTKPRGRGLGLGLSTVYAAVSRCGGRIDVDSEPGRGTTFTLCFPRVSPAEPAAAAPSAGEATRAPGGRETLLLVEDEEVVRVLLARLLEGLGYRVLVAADAAEALERLAAHDAPLDLLVTDIVMPGRSGLELAEELRERQRGLPVLCLSGYADESVERRILALPGVDFLQKPFAPRVLAGRVRELLDARRDAAATTR